MECYPFLTLARSHDLVVRTIPHNKLFLRVYGNQAVNQEPPDIERRVIYNLATHKVAFEK